jgi:translocator protein
MKTNKITKIIIMILVAEIAGGIGSLFTTPAINSWYKTLIRPSISPPNWIFAPVWTTLFLLMGIAAGIIWNKLATLDEAGKKAVKTALAVFTAQLFLNVLWSILFFGFHNPGASLIEIIFLWLAILWTIVAFWKISPRAGSLLIPYILWVSFASYLNYSFWILNR